MPRTRQFPNLSRNRNAMFDRFDLDKDKHIVRNEFRDSLKKYTGIVLQNNDIGRIFKYFGASKGAITRKKFNRLLKPEENEVQLVTLCSKILGYDIRYPEQRVIKDVVKPTAVKTGRKLFREISQGRQAIEREDLKKWAKKHDVDLHRQEIDKIFSAFNSKSSSINYKRFADVVDETLKEKDLITLLSRLVGYDIREDDETRSKIRRDSNRLNRQSSLEAISPRSSLVQNSQKISSLISSDDLHELYDSKRIFDQYVQEWLIIQSSIYGGENPILTRKPTGQKEFTAKTEASDSFEEIRKHVNLLQSQFNVPNKYLANLREGVDSAEASLFAEEQSVKTLQSKVDHLSESNKEFLRAQRDKSPVQVSNLLKSHMKDLSKRFGTLLTCKDSLFNLLAKQQGTLKQLVKISKSSSLGKKTVNNSDQEEVTELKEELEKTILDCLALEKANRSLKGQKKELKKQVKALKRNLDELDYRNSALQKEVQGFHEYGDYGRPPPMASYSHLPQPRGHTITTMYGPRRDSIASMLSNQSARSGLLFGGNHLPADPHSGSIPRSSASTIHAPLPFGHLRSESNVSRPHERLMSDFSVSDVELLREVDDSELLTWE